jgi:hypothetical protein
MTVFRKFEVRFFVGSLVQKIATFAKPENVVHQCKGPAAQTAQLDQPKRDLVFADTKANTRQNEMRTNRK